MKSCFSIFAVTAIVFCFLPSLNTAVGQEASGFHKFTPKVGNPIDAKVLKVSKDWKEMQIQKADGSSFSVAINLLTLDDQQFVKDWILLQPEKSDFELDVKITKELSNLERERYGSAGSTDLETRDLSYNVTIVNKSRESLESPIVEYAVVFEDKVRIYQATDGDWTYSSISVATEQGITGKSTLPDLVYNRDQTIKTDPVKIHKVLGDGNYVYGEDDPQGVLVKISTANGAMVGLYRSSDSGAGFTWDQAIEAAGSGDGTESRRPAANIDETEESTVSLIKETVIPGPILAKGRTIDLEARVKQSGTGEGAIIAMGGKSKGLALFSEGGDLHFIQVIEGDIKTVSAPMPTGTFVVKASLTETELSLTIDDEAPVTAPSHGLFTEDMTAGINVGEDVGSPLMKVGTYTDNFPFAGTIKRASITFGEVGG